MTDKIDGRPMRGYRSVGMAAAVTAVFALVAACGGGSDETGATTSTTEAATTTSVTATSTTEAETTTTAGADGVCEVITPTDIDAALHVTVGPGKDSAADGATICSYESSDGSSQVAVSRYDPAGDLLSATLSSDPQAAEVSGVADGAVIQLDIGSITTQRRGIGLVINVTLDPAPTEVQLVQLARVGAGRL